MRTWFSILFSLYCFAVRSRVFAPGNNGSFVLFCIQIGNLFVRPRKQEVIRPGVCSAFREVLQRVSQNCLWNWVFWVLLTDTSSFLTFTGEIVEVLSDCCLCCLHYLQRPSIWVTRSVINHEVCTILNQLSQCFARNIYIIVNYIILLQIVSSFSKSFPSENSTRFFMPYDLMRLLSRLFDFLIKTSRVRRFVPIKISPSKPPNHYQTGARSSAVCR